MGASFGSPTATPRWYYSSCSTSWKHIRIRWWVLNFCVSPRNATQSPIHWNQDLSPLSYIAGTLIGNPSIKVYDTCSQSGQRVIVPSNRALSSHQVPRLILHPKEHLGLLNGTAFSAAVASLALYDAVQLAFLTEVCTAMATEALLGSRGSFLPFVNEIARPHPGQVRVYR